MLASPAYSQARRRPAGADALAQGVHAECSCVALRNAFGPGLLCQSLFQSPKCHAPPKRLFCFSALIARR